jgi:maltooligosyltrehalose trehalohydrolase
MIRVWAPSKKTVDLVIGETSELMACTEDGWWESNRQLKHGMDYQFLVEGELLPDPRSPWQPDGVHGPSRYVDHTLFKWTDQHFQAKPLQSAIIYELHVGTFTPAGTFLSAIDRLDHLVDLGITHVEIMPVAEFLGDHGWGYDGVFIYAPHHAYGGPEGLKQLVDACHARGLAVLLDVVYNHFGPSGNYLPKFGPYFSAHRQTPWGAGINFDGPDSDEVRRFFCENALMWIRDYHFDGLRLDAVHAIVDTSAIHVLEELAVDVDELKARLGRHLILIAESDLNDPRVVRPWELGGFGLDAQWSDDIHHALHSVLTGETAGYYADFGSIEDLSTAMTKPYVYAGRYSHHRRRRHGRPALNISAHRFVAYLQNHDQLGNRAQGDRVCHLANVDRVKIGAALVLLSPYVPMLFQGEEWGASTPFQYFVDFATEPDLAQAVVNGRQSEFASFGWSSEEIPNPNDAATFARSKLNWNELSQSIHDEMLHWHKSLIALRKSVSAFTTGRLDYIKTHFSEKDQWLVIERGHVSIVCNFAENHQHLPVCCGADYQLLLASKPVDSRGQPELSIPPETVAIFRRKNAC